MLVSLPRVVCGWCPLSLTSSIKDMDSREDGESTIALCVMRLAIRAPEGDRLRIRSWWKVGAISPTIGSKMLMTAIMYTYQLKNMLHSSLLRYVAVFPEKIFDGFVDFLVDFDRISREEFGDFGGIVVGFFFRIHFEKWMEQRLDV